MQVQNMLLGASAALVVGALLLLVLKVQGSPAVDVPEDALAEARQRHERARVTRTAPEATAPELRSSSPAPRTRGLGMRAIQGEAEPEVAPRRARERERGKGRPRLTPDTPPSAERGADSDMGDDVQERMAETNRLYDRRDYEGALAQAKAILADDPGNVRMLRVVVSSACIMGDAELAQRHAGSLPPRDQRQMRMRCERYGVELAAAGDE